MGEEEPPAHAFLCTLPQVAGKTQVGWGQGLVCRSGRLLCVITEDIPVVQEGRIPESCHLGTFLSAVSALTGLLMRWKEQGRRREADLNWNPDTSALSWAVGLGWSVALP